MTVLKDHEGINRALEKYHFFEDCLLRQARLTQFGTAFELEFAYIWDDADPHAAKLADAPRSITLSLQGLREVRIITALPHAVLQAPHLADWGLTEVAVIRLLDDSDSLGGNGGPAGTLHHLAVLWESDRRIDIIFAQATIAEGT
jgi:hypothetical protein